MSVTQFRSFDPPVFKICGQLEVRQRTDPEISLVIAVEEVVIETPNRVNMENIARSNAFARLASFGVDTAILDYQFLAVEFFAARSRSVDSDMPTWTPANDDRSCSAQAIKDMTYLPFDLLEQREVYG